jgi:hypothetical protein
MLIAPRRQSDRLVALFAAVHESAFDAVDGSSICR